MNIAALISTFGVGAYIINIFQFRPKEAYLNDIILPLVVMVLYFASSFNLIYSLYPPLIQEQLEKHELLSS
jgi:hypothetical protein